jgi:peptide-methionine (R)-S-oxide reductase
MLSNQTAEKSSVDMRFFAGSIAFSLIIGLLFKSPAQAFNFGAFRNKQLVRLMATSSLPKDENGWKTILSPSQFRVLRAKGTEPPGYSESTPGELEYELKKKYSTKYPKEGTYTCVGCGSPLYYAKTKFDSGCGWPAFYEGVPGAIREISDADGRRTEILCNNCGSHLGHVFKGEGFPTPTNERHCVNGICLKYEAANNNNSK